MMVAAVDISDPLRGSGDIWIFNVARSVSSRFTYHRANESMPVWSPDDRQLVFFRAVDLYRKDTSTAGAEEVILADSQQKEATDWSADGRFLLVGSRGAEHTSEISVLTVGDSKAQLWQGTPFDENGARFSPDGRWVAYFSDESGRREVYVQGFRDPGERVCVSIGGGAGPVWRRDGKELLYMSEDNKLMAVAVTTAPRFEADAPRPLFAAALRVTPGLPQFEVSADGQRFLLNRMSAESVAPITLVQNWAASLPR